MFPPASFQGFSRLSASVSALPPYHIGQCVCLSQGFIKQNVFYVLEKEKASLSVLQFSAAGRKAFLHLFSFSERSLSG
jgi:hypothetical protein